MSYNFLQLVNDVCQRLNESPLNTSNFSSAVGSYADIKSYVNHAINRINREEFEWPFNHVTKAETLVVDQTKYAYSANTKSVAFDTFMLNGDSSLNVETRKLRVLDYEEYLALYGDHEFNPTDYQDKPSYVVRTRDLSYIVSPPPDQAYTLSYEYYSFPPDMSNWDDVPTVPEPFRWVILEGAMYYAYLFRGGIEEATVSNQLFTAGISDMRKLYINRTEYVRSTILQS